MRKYRAANPHVQLVGNYRISTAQAKSIYALMQIAKCQICGDPDRKVVFDHDHKTGEFRGFLCQACNSALGSFQDSPSLLEAAISYLKLRST